MESWRHETRCVNLRRPRVPGPGGRVSTVTLRVVEPGTTDVALTQRQPSLDDESRAWLDNLRAAGKTTEEAIASLHVLLLHVDVDMDDQQGMGHGP